MTYRIAFILIFALISISAHATQLNIKVSHEVVASKTFIMGKTNLPVGTKIGVDVSSDNGDYSAQSYDLLVQADGTFKSEGFSDSGAPLIGKYKVEVISYINEFWQDKKILKQLAGFKGKEIKDDEISIHYSMQLGSAGEQKKKLDNMPTIEQKAIAKKYCYAQQASLLCDYLQMRMDTQGKIENQLDGKTNDTKYRMICLEGINEAFADEDKGLCSKTWKKYGCNGTDIPRLVQENPFKKPDANLCEY